MKKDYVAYPILLLLSYLAVFPGCRLKTVSGLKRHTTRGPEIQQECIAVLREGLRTERFWPFIHACEGLIISGHGDSVRPLLKNRLLRETDERHRCGLARELVRAGDQTGLSILNAIMSEPDNYGRIHAAESFYKLCRVGHKEIFEQAMRQNASLNLRIYAAAALACSGNTVAVAVLRDMLRSPDADARALASYVIRDFGNERDISQLRRNLNCENRLLYKSMIIFGLASLEDMAAQQKLVELLNSKNSTVRALAALTIGECGLKSLADVLRQRLSDEDVDVRIRAAQALLTLLYPTRLGISVS